MKWSDKGSGGDFKNPDPGTHTATCYKIIDIGTQVTEFQGKKKEQRKVIIGWELDQLMEDGRPFTTQARYTMSLNEKANLRKHLETWRGVKFKPEELEAFDPKALLGATCLLSLVESDKGYINVQSVMKLPKGTPKPVKVNPSVFFSLDEFDQVTFEGLSDGIQKLIMQSPEYMNLGAAPAEVGGDKGHSDIPF